MCGGLKAPPRIPTRKLPTYLPRALDDVLVARQLAHPDRAASVALPGGVADLGAHAEDPPVGEAGGGVHVRAGGVHARAEGPCRVHRRWDERLRLAAAI